MLVFTEDFDFAREHLAHVYLRLALVGGAYAIELDFNDAPFVGGCAVRLAIRAAEARPDAVTVRGGPDVQRLLAATGTLARVGFEPR